MSGPRVVLLARAGGVRDRTAAALRAADAELVATLDPANTGPDEVRATAPQALLVVLDPVVEQELDRFEPLLADGSLDVMYEDADVAARREGWEAARWARHVRAKLHGHDNVLPPSAAPQAAQAAGAGAVVVAAGIGGPDAVRQVLAGLPAAFPRPVLLFQHVDGDQYDKLLRQIGRVTPMPVRLAAAGMRLEAGHVYVVPQGLGLQVNDGGLGIGADDGDMGLAALHPADSALLLLSGADAALVDAAWAMRGRGALVLGQSSENCFDPAASDALVARGGEAFGLAGLSRQLLDRWPA